MSAPATDSNDPSLPTGRLKGGCRQVFCRLLLGVLILILLLAVGAGGIYWYYTPSCERTDGIVYGQRNGHDLTFDMARPKKPNGAAVLVMISGKWKSHPESFRSWKFSLTAPLLRSGYTVFLVAHRSQPETTIQNTVADVNRAVRYIRHHAADYRIDPNRIGVTGGSSGGHLCLMLATQGGLGPADAPDPIDRESSAVQAVAIFFPVTNLLDLGHSTENAGDGGPPKSFRKSFGPEGTDPEKWPALARSLSPVFHVHPGQPPILILHGDADTLVPLEQSEWLVEASKKANTTPVNLIIRKGKKHGWLGAVLDLRLFVKWFDQYL